MPNGFVTLLMIIWVYPAAVASEWTRLPTLFVMCDHVCVIVGSSVSKCVLRLQERKLSMVRIPLAP